MFACIYIPEFSVHALRYGPNASDAILDCAEAWSPRVERAGPDAVALDIDGLERLWGSYADIAAALSDKANELGFTANVAVASNPDAAIHAAKGFRGITVIPRGMEAERLRDLPIALLSPPEGIRETLERWGIRTFGALAALPANDLAVRLGDVGVPLHRQAGGRSLRLLVPHQAPLRFIESMELDYEISLLEPLSFVLARLLGQICARLKCRGLATHEIHLTLGSVEYILRLPIPTQDSRLLLKLLQLDVESRPPKTAISSVKIEAVHAKPRVAQHGLFVPLSPEPEKLELTLARIAGIVGPENIGSAELMDTHRPGAFRMQRFIVSLEDGCREDCRKARPVEEQACIALRTFRPAQESTVDMRDGQPRWIAFRGAHGPIVAASGPWRTSGNWWTNEPWSRDEWDIAMSPSPESVTLYLIYCDQQSGRWYVEGVYD